MPIPPLKTSNEQQPTTETKSFGLSLTDNIELNRDVEALLKLELGKDQKKCEEVKMAIESAKKVLWENFSSSGLDEYFREKALIEEAEWQLSVIESKAKTKEELATVLADKASKLQSAFSDSIAKTTAELHRDFNNNPRPYHAAADVNFYQPNEETRLAIEHAKKAAQQIGIDPDNWYTLVTGYDGPFDNVNTCSIC